MRRRLGYLGLLLGLIALVIAAGYGILELVVTKYPLPAWAGTLAYGIVLITGCISIIWLYRRLTWRFAWSRVISFPIAAIPRDYARQPFVVAAGHRGAMAILVDDRVRSTLEIRGTPGHLRKNEDGMICFEGDNAVIVLLGDDFERYFSDHIRRLLDQDVRIFCGYEWDQEAGEHLIQVDEWVLPD